MGAVLDVNELGLDDQAVGALKDLARKYGSNLEGPSDLLGVYLHALVAEHRAPRHDAEPGELRQQVNDALGDSVTEVFRIRIDIRIRQRQDG